MINNNTEFFILCGILLSIFLIVGITCNSITRYKKKKDEEFSKLMYSILQKTRELDEDYLSLKEQNQQYANDIKRLQELINSLGVLEKINSESISSLTSSIKNVIQENRVRENTKIYPTPQLSEMIRTTINEYIHQEITLIRDMRIPISPTDPVTAKISKRVISTYPHVDEEWIMYKVVEIVTEICRQ